MRKSVLSKIVTLVFSAFFIRILGFIFRIYLSNVSGEEGCGLYHLVVSVYTFGAAISSFGISQTLSKLVAGCEKHSEKILRTALIITGAVSFFACSLLFINSEYIADFILKDSRTLKSIRIISFSFIPIGIFSSLSGYFNGLGKVKYPARGQIIEQITRILFVFIFAKKGLSYGLEYGIFVMSLGIVLGEFISMLYLYFSYRFNLKHKSDAYTKKSYFKDILKISIPIAFGGYITSFIHTVESIILPKKLTLWGLTQKESISLLGVIKGMAVPVVFLPCVVIGAMSVIMLPEISKREAMGDNKRIKKLSFKVLFISFLSGCASAFLLYVFADKISLILYKSINPSFYIKFLGFTLPFLFFNIISVSIINGLGKQTFSMVENIMSGVIKLLFVIFIVPIYGIKGYIIGYIFSECVGFLMFFILIYKIFYEKNCKKP